MANNRIFLRCRNCGSIFFLGKGFGGAYYTLEDYYKTKNMIEELNEFYNEHTFCDKKENESDIKYAEPKFIKKDVHYENNFEIAYEFDYGDDD